MDMKNAGFGTLAVHAGQESDPLTKALLSPMYMTSTYVWTPELRERYLSGDVEGIYTYGRSRNPTQNELQAKIAALEGAENCLVTASGMAAISLVLLQCAHAGDHIIAYKTLYSGTYKFLTKICPEVGIEVSFVEGMDEETMSKALRPNTKAIYTETVANPTMEVLDLDAFAAFGKAHGLVSIIDNTFTTPYLLKPLAHGVDVVVHSTTKYINGHGDLVGGAIAGSFPFVDKIRASSYQEFGPVPSPFSCWLMLRSLKTLHLRMQRHSASAMTLALWLEQQPQIEKVIYPGLPSHPQHDLATRLFGGRGYGGMLSFVVKGGLKPATALCDNLNIAKYCVSLGDCDTMIEQPPLMTHGMLPKEVRERMGIDDGLVRLSVGVEDVEDIMDSFTHAFTAI